MKPGVHMTNFLYIKYIYFYSSSPPISHRAGEQRMPGFLSLGMDLGVSFSTNSTAVFDGLAMVV